MTKFRVRFEPIDVEDSKDFVDLYNKIRTIINSVYAEDHIELIPAIRKIYVVDDNGFPVK